MGNRKDTWPKNLYHPSKVVTEQVEEKENELQTAKPRVV